MKYTKEIEIRQPIEKIIELFENPDHLNKWMEGLQSFEHLSGTPGEPGAKSRMKFKMGKREIEMVETITVRNLPDELSTSYDTNGVLNTVKNKFVKLSETETRLTVETAYEFKGFMKLIGLIMPGAFKKQTSKYLADFKAFAESQ